MDNDKNKPRLSQPAVSADTGINEKKVYAKLVHGENYEVTEYSLTQEWKEALIY